MAYFSNLVDRSPASFYNDEGVAFVTCLAAKADLDLAASQAEVARLRGALEDVRWERELEKQMKYCAKRRKDGLNGIAVDEDTPAKEWQKMNAELKRLLDRRSELLG